VKKAPTRGAIEDEEVDAMKVLKSSVFWGVLMMVAGAVLLLEALGVLAAGGLIWSGLFGVAGLGFGYVFFRSHENWWTAIPAGALLGLAALVAWGELAPHIADKWGGSLFLGALGAGFWAVYLRGWQRWWAIIPGGALFTLALVAGLAPVAGELAISAVFFLGLALTFALLALVPTAEGRMRWPIIPAGVLAILSMLVGIGAERTLNYVWPAALVASGLYLILRALGFRRKLGPHA
jgi:hypothetical protein